MALRVYTMEFFDLSAPGGIGESWHIKAPNEATAISEATSLAHGRPFRLRGSGDRVIYDSQDST